MSQCNDNEQQVLGHRIRLSVDQPHSRIHRAMSEARDTESASRQMLQLLAKRADAIERRLSGAAPDLSDPVERVKEHWLRSQATSVKFKWVPPNYYETPLEERARELECAPEQLCKTMIMENKAFVGDTMGHDETSTPTRHQFYLVVVQYTAKLSAQKISAAVTRLMPAGKKLSRARCNMAVAPEEVGLSMSGFPHNGVTVFGSLTPVPIILSEAVLRLRPAFLWMGGGHPLLKLGVSASDLVHRLGATVADISIPRDGVGIDYTSDDDGPL